MLTRTADVPGEILFTNPQSGAEVSRADGSNAHAVYRRGILGTSREDPKWRPVVVSREEP